VAHPVAGDGLIWEARLVHAEPGRRVVEAAAWRDGQCLGRSLGEAEGAEEAEQRAFSRLQQRLTALPTAGSTTPTERRSTAVVRRESPAGPIGSAAGPADRAEAAAASAVQTDFTLSDAEPPAPIEPDGRTDLEPNGPAAAEPLPHDPEDWSEELAELDVQLQRLGWDRAQEGVYLQRAFAHPSRSRLTRYADLAAYLRCLRDLPNGCSPEQAPVPLRRRDLLEQSDALLGSLGWDAQRGRALLEQQFQRASRQQLSDEQLLHFNMLLESELIALGSGPAAAASPD
jgi:hypothetical protein